jgi:uncharacterized protein with FMN-binding domain
MNKDDMIKVSLPCNNEILSPNLELLIKWINSKKLMIPEQYRHTAEIDIIQQVFQDDIDDGFYITSFKIYYYRPKTSEEIECEKIQHEMLKNKKRKERFSLYLSLREEFGPL